MTNCKNFKIFFYYSLVISVILKIHLIILVKILQKFYVFFYFKEISMLLFLYFFIFISYSLFKAILFFPITSGFDYLTPFTWSYLRLKSLAIVILKNHDLHHPIYQKPISQNRLLYKKILVKFVFVFIFKTIIKHLISSFIIQIFQFVSKFRKSIFLQKELQHTEFSLLFFLLF